VARSDKSPRLNVRYFDDSLVLSGGYAWTYMQVPLVPYEFLSREAREDLCVRITMGLSQLVTNSQDPVDVHLKVIHRPFDARSWEAGLRRKTSQWQPAPVWDGYVSRMRDRVEQIGFSDKQVFLGVCLGPRTGVGSPRGGHKKGILGDVLSPLTKVMKGTEKASGLEDAVIPDWELEHWWKAAENVRRILSQSSLRATEVTAESIADLIMRPLWPGMEPPPPSATPARRWGPGQIHRLVEGVATNNYKYVEVHQPTADGPTDRGYAATLAVSRFPDVLHFPEQEPWMHFTESLLIPADFSTRMSVVPAQRVQKDVGKKLADAKDQAQHIAESGTAVPLKVREQLDVATVLEYQIDKDRSPWAYARHHITVTGTDPEQITKQAKTLIEKYRELGIDLAWPSGEQLDLLLESVPGDKVRSHAYQQRQELAVVAGGMPMASSDCGDNPGSGGDQKGWRGPYLGATNSRVLQPVFFSPHVAMTRNYPPGVAITGSPGGGKALALDTPIPTPSGWTTMGDLEVGDEVFDENGHVCRVTFVTETMLDHECFDVVFDDGSVITADADHRWLTETQSSRASQPRWNAKRTPWASQQTLDALARVLADTDPEATFSVAGAVRTVHGGPSETAYRSAAEDMRGQGIIPLRHTAGDRSWELWPARELLSATYDRLSRPRNDQRHRRSVPQVRTTRELSETVTVHGDSRSNHSIVLTEALDLPEIALPLDPYLLGVWLADGTSVRAEVTSADAEIIEAFREAGYRITMRESRPGSSAVTFGVGGGMQSTLRELGILGAKRIPEDYLRASRAQRTALLQGLMDGDGWCDTDGGCNFVSVNEMLVRDVQELLHSLGYKVAFRATPDMMALPDGSRKSCGTQYRLAFTATEPVFRLDRKRVRQPDTARPTTRRRYITEVRATRSVPVRCITVDSPSHLYLAGESMIPTHNTFLAFNLAYQMAASGVWTVYIDPKADAKPMGELPGLGNPRVFDLRDGNDGMLDPFSLGSNKSESSLLALETLRLLLGGSVSEEREEALLNAIEQVVQTPQPSLGAVVDVLTANTTSSSARNLGAVLRTIRELPFARLCFSPIGSTQLRPEDGLTVVTLLGLDLPNASTQPEDYSYENRLAVSVMYLLTRYARQLMLNMNKNYPKAICIDEAWAITSTPQGAKLIPEIARMGRSHNTALVLVSQNASDLMAESVTNSLSTKFAFRSTIPAEVDSVLELMGLSQEEGFQGYIRGLETGQCLMQDVDGRVAAIQIDNWDKELMRAFDTNPETRGKKE